MAFVTERVKEAIGNAEKTFRSRIDRFGVTQPNIQKLEATGRILVELPGVKDKARVRELLQGTANLEFWETYENGEIAPMLDKANAVISNYLYGAAAKKDSLTPQDSLAVNTSSVIAPTTAVAKQIPLKDSTAAQTASINPQDTAIKGFQKRAPLYAFYQNVLPLVPLKGRVTLDEKGNPKAYAEGATIGIATSRADTAKVNAYLRIARQKMYFLPN